MRFIAGIGIAIYFRIQMPDCSADAVSGNVLPVVGATHKMKPQTMPAGSCPSFGDKFVAEAVDG